MVWAGAHLALLGVAMAMHGVALGFKVWAFAFLIPALFALWTIMFFNYIQHVHADPWSENDHSRSFDGKLINFLLFNNGFHAAHHENPGMHWSQLPAAHAQIAPHIDPRLVERNMWWYFCKCYFLSAVLPRFRTHQIGRAPYDVSAGLAA